MHPANPDQSAEGQKQVGLARVLLAFESVPFRWLWASFFFTSMSMGVRMLAQGWLVLELTDSPFWVGAVVGLQGLGQLVFGAFGGTIVDRLDKRKVLASLYAFSGVTALVLGLLTITGNVALWHVILVSLSQGVTMATMLPAANFMVYQTVGAQRLLNGMAARMVAMNVTRIIGSIIAGFLIDSFGVGASYIFASVSVWFGAAFLLYMQGSYAAASHQEPFWTSVGHGIKYVWATLNIRRLMFLSILMETFAFSHFVMMPVMAKDVLHVGGTGLGYLSAASGVGAMLSTTAVAGLGDFRRKGVLLVGSALVTGLFLILFAFSPWFLVSLALVAIVGGTIMAYDVTMATMLQLISVDAMRGRVMGIYGLTFGFTPVGGFLVGAIAAAASTPIAVALGGAIVAVYVGAILLPAEHIRSSQKPLASP